MSQASILAQLQAAIATLPAPPNIPDATQAQTMAALALYNALQLGVTDGSSPAAGEIGEYVSSFIAWPGTAIANNTPTNIRTISLTAGDWDIGCFATLNGTGVTGTRFEAGWSTASAAFQNYALQTAETPTMPTAAVASSLMVPPTRFSGSGTIYMPCRVLYSAGSSVAIYGALFARRRR